MKKLCFTSLLAMMVAPAVAAPSHTSSTFPANGKMLEDYLYQNQANQTNLKVASGTATTTAQYDNCPAEYPNSDEGATSTDQCYTACTVSDFPANSHIASVTGKNYQGANETDTCAIATCDTGYTKTNHIVYPQGTPDLTTIIGITEAGTGVGYKSNSGTGSNDNESTYGITNNGEFVVDYGSSKGKIHGYARCSTQSGDNQYYAYTNPTTMSTLPDSSGQYCWCQLDGYTPNGQSMQSLSAPWVFEGDVGDADRCADLCASSCAGDLQLGYDAGLAFRAAMFASLGNSVASCDANVIQITWADASAEDIVANDAGSVTYGGDIRTPKKAVHKPGKIFTGWTFNTPSGN